MLSISCNSKHHDRKAYRDRGEHLRRGGPSKAWRGEPPKVYLDDDVIRATGSKTLLVQKTQNSARTQPMILTQSLIQERPSWCRLAGKRKATLRTRGTLRSRWQYQCGIRSTPPLPPTKQLADVLSRVSWRTLCCDDARPRYLELVSSGVLVMWCHC